jgi:uncharacterized protein
MKLHSDSNDTSLRITAYDTQSVTVGEQQLSSNFIITTQALFIEVPRIEIQQLSWQALHQLHDLELDVLLVGTGANQQFPTGHFYAELSRERIGLEAMSSAAACRTFNILAGEDRRVAALIMFDE